MALAIHDASDVTQRYSNGEYLNDHPGWHSERSPWKAAHVTHGLRAVGIQPESACDIGCGTGLALAEVARSNPSIRRAVGFEPSPDSPIHPRATNIDFRREDATQTSDRFDLALMLDVFEHVEDYIGFLRACRRLANYHAFHIPLDANALLLVANGFSSTRRGLGHLHYFCDASALATLRHCGYEPLHWHFTKAAWDGPPSPGNRRNKWSPLNIARQTLHAISPVYSHRILGGSALLVIASTDLD